MLQIRMMSGEELTTVPVEEVGTVRELKQRLHQLHGLPPRFRQRLPWSPNGTLLTFLLGLVQGSLRKGTSPKRRVALVDNTWLLGCEAPPSELQAEIG